LWLLIGMSENNVRFFRTRALATSVKAPPYPFSINPFGFDGHVRSLREIERDLLFLALRRHSGCITKAAAELCIGRSTFYRRLAEIIRPAAVANDQQLT
jgi:transcriptional regulator of acetoin/glycerol metabolism